MSLRGYTKEELEKELQRRQTEKNRLNELGPEKRLAETLHSMLCHWNHTDGCSWYYETWEAPNNNTHMRYLDKARKALEIADEDTIIKILSIVR